MSLGEILLDLRKKKMLSQEEVAEKLGVTRQTVSKWETDQSTPDFDKIAPLCELYGISADELLTGKRGEKEETYHKNIETERQSKKAMGISFSIFLYFISVIWIMVAVAFLQINPIVATAIFLFICALATFVIVYTCMVYKKEKTVVETKEEKLRKQIEEVLSIFTVIIYLFVSFSTGAWHITWILWIVYSLIVEIIKLIFVLRGNRDEK